MANRIRPKYVHVSSKHIADVHYPARNRGGDDACRQGFCYGSFRSIRGKDCGSARAGQAAFCQDAQSNAEELVGTVKIQSHVSAALAEPYEELRGELSEQHQLFVDESSTKENEQKAGCGSQSHH